MALYAARLLRDAKKLYNLRQKPRPTPEKFQAHEALPSIKPLQFVAIDILGELIKTPRGNRFLLVVTDRYSTLVRKVPIVKITAIEVSKAFVHHWVFLYGPPVSLLSDSGKQFTAKFFQHVCLILGVENLLTTSYHPQCNGQVERFNRTILDALRHYVADHPHDWDLFSDPVAFAYNTQVHRVTKFSPFELVLSRPPNSLAIQAQPTIKLLHGKRPNSRRSG